MIKKLRRQYDLTTSRQKAKTSATRAIYGTGQTVCFT